MRQLTTPGWIARHLLAVVLVLGFLALGWWQLRRASGGNVLSWAYAVEWPVFAGFVVFIWLREVRLARNAPDAAEPDLAPPPPGVRRPVHVVRAAPPPSDPADAELDAYNDYLAWLNANPGARPGDYPGRNGRKADAP
jgi:hypothetical protein